MPAKIRAFPPRPANEPPPPVTPSPAALPLADEKRTEVVATKIGPDLKSAAQQRATNIGVTMSTYVGSLLARDAADEAGKGKPHLPATREIEAALREAIVAEADNVIDSAERSRITSRLTHGLSLMWNGRDVIT